MAIPQWTRIALAFLVGIVAVVVLRQMWLGPMRGRGDADPMMVRSYDVAPEIAREVQGALNAALHPSGNAQLGEVTLAPGGALVVTARLSVQASVKDVIEDIAERRLPPTPTVTFDVWIVSGTPGTAAVATDASAALAELEPALDTLRKSRGPMRFELLERLSTMGRVGGDKTEFASAQSRLEIESTLRRAADGADRIFADIELEYRPRGDGSPAGLESQVELVPGELLVVGQSYAGGAPGARELYYIVRAQL